MSDTELKLTKYEYDKGVLMNQKPLNTIILNRKINEAAEDMLTHKYWMLLCRERYDFTLFNILEPTIKEDIAAELRVCINNRGQVIDCGRQPDGSWRFWIRGSENEVAAYYLFVYDEGVIEV